MRSTKRNEADNDLGSLSLSVSENVHKVELSLGNNFYLDSTILNSIKDISGVSKIEEI